MITGKVWYFLVFLLYLLIHLFNLPISPLPWFDETFFSSISKSFSEHGRFVPLIASSAFEGKEFFMQGPLYYMISGAVFRLFGFGIFQFRLVSLLFGIGVVFMSSLLLKKNLASENRWIRLFPVLFLLDPFLNMSMHEGRMDTLCLFLFLSSIYMLRSDWKHRHLLSGFLAALAVLTTLRIVLLFPLFLLILFRDFNANRNKEIAIWILALAIPYLVWIIYAFGGIGGFFNYYSEVNVGMHSVDSGYIGGNFYIPKHEYWIIAIVIFTLLVSVYFNSKKAVSQFTIICLMAIGCFYLLVHDLGPYSVFILPFYYLLLFNQVSFVPNSKLRSVILISLFIFNAGFFILKNSHVASTLDLRSKAVALRFVKNHIPEGSKVVGDAVYYYAAIKAGSDFQYMDKFIDLAERERRHREEWRYQYAIVSDIERNRYPEAIDLYSKKGSWIQLSRLELSAENDIASWIEGSGLLSSHEKSGYSATIYRRSE